MEFKTICACCGEEIKQDVVHADPWGDGKDSTFCSFECVEHVADEWREYMDSYDV
ncbi:hypothetical protein PMW_34 [Pseudomonas phage phiPMW]|uniref:MYM-type domain-containing protein n=1 Tax=Pseudomonas phage phiPMW TaxID=1815582 RepID=A0A1S5R189_9CAUD|nr:hypothetical protein FDG97_gp034 [Pseudomonas phage phiPMW]ANA49159.1 hypothetical protein PMW_34 [Pseudomonas phage phiPMW]